MTLLIESQMDVVISITAFIAVFVVVMLFIRYRIKRAIEREINIGDNQRYVIDSVLSKHLTKIDKVMSLIGELKARLDLLETRDSVSILMPQTSHMEKSYSHVLRSGNLSDASRTFTSGINPSDKIGGDNNPAYHVTSQGLTDDKSHKYARLTVSNTLENVICQETSIYILKLLQESPRNVREIQHNIGKTREHISRLMKKLHDEGLVDRDMNTKPFVYKITDEGRKLLE